MQSITEISTLNSIHTADDYISSVGNKYMAFRRFGVGCSVDYSKLKNTQRLLNILLKNNCCIEQLESELLESLNLSIIKNEL